LEDGRKQYIRAYWDSREWLFRIAHPDGETWMPLEKPGPERWLELRDLLFRKYQRKKAAVEVCGAARQEAGRHGTQAGWHQDE
jgi:hypothetical protein